MKIQRFVVAVGVMMSFAWASGAWAQAQSTQTTQTTQSTSWLDGLENEAIISGFVGSSFGGDFDDETVDFGGSFSWLWRSVLGGEFIAGFSPNFNLLGDSAIDADDTMVNSYMFNAIGAIPLGENRNWQPFVSGGIGALTLNTGNDTEAALNIGDVDETELGGNIGFGVMGFGNQWGFRGDIRYFSQLGDPDEDTVFLNDLNFWRANAGVAFRW